MTDDASGASAGRELRAQLEQVQAEVAALKQGARASVELERLEAEGRAELAMLDGVLTSLSARTAEARARNSGRATQARSANDTRLVLESASSFDGLTAPMVAGLVAFNGMVLAWTVALNPFRHLSTPTLQLLCALGVGLPGLVLWWQAWGLGRQRAARERREASAVSPQAAVDQPVSALEGERPAGDSERDRSRQ